MPLKASIFFYRALIGIASLAITATAYASCLGDNTSAKTYKVYVVPQLPAAQLYARWATLLEQVGKDAGQCFELVVPNSIPQFEIDLQSGNADFAYMNPYHLVMSQRDSKYIPLVASTELLSGVLAVRHDSKVNSIRDLNDQKIAFPAPNAFAASLLIRATLAKEGIKFDPVYVKSHSNVYRSVVRGDMIAGGGIQSTYDAEPEELKSQLRILMETKGFHPHPFAAHPRIPADIQQRVQASFLKIAKTQAGEKLLDDAQLSKPRVVTYESDYQPLETLDLGKFVVNSAY